MGKPHTFIGMETEFLDYAKVGDDGTLLPAVIVERMIQRKNGQEEVEETRNHIVWENMNEPMADEWFELPFPDGIVIDDWDEQDARRQ